uniref:Uncharacterized protein n=1 Tax=Cucumis melo TaxID=3656 RepID=A0A9I9E904_CUCME
MVSNGATQVFDTVPAIAPLINLRISSKLTASAEENWRHPNLKNWVRCRTRCPSDRHWRISLRDGSGLPGYSIGSPNRRLRRTHLVYRLKLEFLSDPSRSGFRIKEEEGRRDPN